MTAFRPGGPARYRHQRRGLRKIIKTNGVCALLFEPGTGKTAVALDFASILAIKTDRPVKVLVAAPLAAVDTWVDQAALWVSPDVDFWAEALGGTIRERIEALASRNDNIYRRTKYRKGQMIDAAHVQKSLRWNARKGDGSVPVDRNKGPGGMRDYPGEHHPQLIIEVVNLDTFASRATVGSQTMADKVLDGVKRFAPDLIIVDESHKIKGANSNASMLLARIAKHVKYRLILTGTVMPHSPLDVYAQWRFLEPTAFGKRGAEAKWNDFFMNYAVPGGWMGKEVRRFQNLDHMQDIMAKNSIAVMKVDALDLPPSQDIIVPVHLSPKEQAAYDDMRDDLVAKYIDHKGFEAETSVVNRLSQMLRLRQVTSGHLPTDDGDLVTLGDSKVRTIASIVEDNLAGQKRIVVFCYFTHEVDAIAKRLATKDTEVLVIKGATPKPERLELRHRFGSDDPARLVLVAQVKTISLAVNELVTASNAIFGSLSQQRDDLIQGRDRLTRIGQTLPVTFWFVEAPGTIDEVIHTSHDKRTDLEQAVLQYLKEGTTS